MRALVVTAGGAATIFAVAPLAAALRAAGHDVLMATNQDNVATVAGLGLPAAAVTDVGMYRAMCFDRDGTPVVPPADDDGQIAFAGRGFARLAAASLPGLAALADAWRPDVVVGGSLAHAAPLLAARIGVPFVRQADDLHERTAVDFGAASVELLPELAAQGLDAIPAGDLFVEITPPSLRATDAERGVSMHWRPLNRQVPLEPWMHLRNGRPRVLLTSGSRAEFDPLLGAGFFDRLVELPALAGVDVLVATSPDVAATVLVAHPGLHAGWLPLDVVAPTCDLVVHHGGGITALTALSGGTPALALPPSSSWAIPLRRIDARGASITLDPAGDLGTAVEALLTDPSYRSAAEQLGVEMAAQQPAADVVAAISALVPH